jgi:hypothetical protein
LGTLFPVHRAWGMLISCTFAQLVTQSCRGHTRSLTFRRMSRLCRRGKCYHCGSGEQVRRNLCVECRVKAFRTSPADVMPVPTMPKSGKSVSTPRSGPQSTANVPNPFTAAGGYRYCQGNCSTIPRPLNEFSHGDSKKCNWCNARFVLNLCASPHFFAKICVER